MNDLILRIAIQSAEGVVEQDYLAVCEDQSRHGLPCCLAMACL